MVLYPNTFRHRFVSILNPRMQYLVNISIKYHRPRFLLLQQREIIDNFQSKHLSHMFRNLSSRIPLNNFHFFRIKLSTFPSLQYRKNLFIEDFLVSNHLILRLLTDNLLLYMLMQLIPWNHIILNQTKPPLIQILLLKRRFIHQKQMRITFFINISRFILFSFLYDICFLYFAKLDFSFKDEIHVVYRLSLLVDNLVIQVGDFFSAF